MLGKRGIPYAGLYKLLVLISMCMMLVVAVYSEIVCSCVNLYVYKMEEKEKDRPVACAAPLQRIMIASKYRTYFHCGPTKTPT